MFVRDEQILSAEMTSAKRSLRKEKISCRRSLAPDFRRQADAAISASVVSLLNEKRPSSLVAYVTDGTEPDLSSAISEFLSHPGTKLYLPRFETSERYSIVSADPDRLVPGKWGIPEPPADAPAAPEAELDGAVWLVPGVAFDSSLRRLGRGKGIYDRLLEKTERYCAGIFYECQRCDGIPSESHDRRMNAVITERGIFGSGVNHIRLPLQEDQQSKNHTQN